MADYIYLLENRLSASQQSALRVVREVARSQGLTIFLVGGAVRDLTSGSPVRDLDVVVQGNAHKLKKQIELSGASIVGDSSALQTLYARFPGSVRMEIGSTLSVTYPKSGKPVMKAATILDDLRRRDFTANAMALSLNEGSYGLLMDPLNGVADIENRELRLVSNYGFIEDPVRMIRAVRFSARLGWAMDEKTQARYETGKQEKYIDALSDFHRGYETEEIFHEEDPLRVLRKLEEEGWMKHLFPAITVAKANAAELEKLRDVQTQLQLRGIQPDAAAANFPLLTTKLSTKEVAALKGSFVRPGFVKVIESLDGQAKEFAALLTSKSASTPSQTWKLIEAAKPEAVLWVAYSSKNGAIQTKLKNFQTEWPQARNKIPYTLMQEMRITPELPGYDELVEKLFFELMDEKLGTVEEMKAYLESYSPPAPPPPVHLRRARATKKEAKVSRSRKKAETPAGEDSGTELTKVAAAGQDKAAVGKTEPKSVSEPAKTASKKAAPVAKTPATVHAAKTAAPTAKAAASGKKAPTPVAAPAKSAAKQVGAVKKAVAVPKKAASASAKKPVPAVKKAVPAKTTTPAKKAAAVKAPQKSAKPAAKKAPPAKKVVVKKAASPTKKVATKAAPAKKPAPAKKVAAKAAPAKKPVKVAAKKR